MITAYFWKQGILHQQEILATEPFPEETLWLDVYRPDDDERQWLNSYFVEDVPEEDDIKEIEASARFYIDQDGVHINSLFPQRVQGEVRAINISFNIRTNLLITLREDDVGLLRLLRNYLRLGRVEATSSVELFIELFNLKVEYLSDLIEDVYTVLEDVGEEVFQNEELDDTVKMIMRQEDTNGKIRLSLLDTQRALRFINRYVKSKLDDEQRKDVKEMLADIDSLMPHSQFIFDKLNFLLQAAVGISGLQQNKIIKIFSVAAVVFLPPTVIASAYGMNFTNMPELSWAFGYPMAIALMFASAGGTYLFFKRKGWL